MRTGVFYEPGVPGVLPECVLQPPASAVETRADRADRNLQLLRGFFVAEAEDFHHDDDVAVDLGQPVQRAFDVFSQQLVDESLFRCAPLE